MLRKPPRPTKQAHQVQTQMRRLPLLEGKRMRYPTFQRHQMAQAIVEVYHSIRPDAAPPDKL